MWLVIGCTNDEVCEVWYFETEKEAVKFANEMLGNMLDGADYCPDDDELPKVCKLTHETVKTNHRKPKYCEDNDMWIDPRTGDECASGEEIMDLVIRKVGES